MAGGPISTLHIDNVCIYKIIYCILHGTNSIRYGCINLLRQSGNSRAAISRGHERGVLGLRYMRHDVRLGVIEKSRAVHWRIPNIQQTLSRLGTMKPTVFGLLDFTASYHQTPLDPASRHFAAFMAMGNCTSGPELPWD